MKYFAHTQEKYNSEYIYYNKLTNQPLENSFYNVDDNGNVWQSKYEQKYAVECRDVIENALNHSVYYKDRIANDVLSLPYKLNDIKINVNDQVKASVFNNSIDKLYNNMLYLYSNCFIANNYLPFKCERWFGKYKKDNNSEVQNFAWNNTDEKKAMNFSYTESLFDNDPINIRLINNIRESVVFQVGDYTYLFAISTIDVDQPMAEAPFANRLICLKTNINDKDYPAKLILNTQYIDDKSDQDIDTINENGERYNNINYDNNLTFNSLNSITSDNERYIYLLDNNNNHVYMYDIYNIIYEDKLFKNRLMLVNIFGDQDAMGNMNYKFINPSLIRFVNNQIVVFDTGDDSIKIYDKYFNWIGTINNRNFAANIPMDIIYSIITNKYYLLTRDAYILQYDNQFKLEDKIFSGIYLDNDEYCSKFYMSYNDSNICYLTTNRRIFKKFITKLSKNIGSFLFQQYQIVRPQQDVWNFVTDNWDLDLYPWRQYSTQEIDYYVPNVKCMSIIPQNNENDRMYVILNSRILDCEDNISYVSLIANDNNTQLNYYSDFSLYELDDIHIKNEYVQSLTYNKSLNKLLYNLTYLASKIIFKPTIAYDNYTNILIKELNYIQNDLLDTKNVRIYDNENVDVMVINRIIERIYDFLVKLLNNIQSDIINTKKSIETNIELL